MASHLIKYENGEPPGAWLPFTGNAGDVLRGDGTFGAPPAGQAFPVGSVFIGVVATNPATLLGYGTWSAFGAGRVLVGLDAGDPDFDTAEKLSGTKTAAISAHSGAAVADHASHTHTYTQVPNHVHVQSVGTAATGALAGYTYDASTNTSVASGYSTANPTGGVATGTTNGPGAALSHSITQPSAHSDISVVQPSLAVYFWKRTA